MTAVLRCLAGMGAKMLRVFAGQLMWQAADWCHDRWCRRFCGCGALNAITERSS